MYVYTYFVYILYIIPVIFNIFVFYNYSLGNVFQFSSVPSQDIGQGGG